MNIYLQSAAKIWILVFAITITLFSCTKDEEPVLPPSIEISPEESEVSLVLNEALDFEAISTSNTSYQQEWVLNDEQVSTEDTYTFQSDKAGEYILVYRAYNESGEFTKEYKITVAAPERPITDESNAYVTTLFEYRPAPGQFINKAPGNHESAEGILGGKGLVTLGAWGGYIVLGFDHTVVNSDEEDIMIYGNAMTNFAEPGVIYVMQDENGNGEPDDTWYELVGSEFGKDGVIRDYSVTYTRPEPATTDIPWKDNQGNEGVVKTNNFHRQPYYPEWITENEYTLTGVLLPSGNIDMSNPNMIISDPFEFGYADNLEDGDAIDISNAIDAEGNKIDLTGIDFIKIQTGIQANMGWLGELSTEIVGVADLRLLTEN